MYGRFIMEFFGGFLGLFATRLISPDLEVGITPIGVGITPIGVGITPIG